MIDGNTSKSQAHRESTSSATWQTSYQDSYSNTAKPISRKTHPASHFKNPPSPSSAKDPVLHQAAEATLQPNQQQVSKAGVMKEKKKTGQTTDWISEYKTAFKPWSSDD
jgi:hypothetical protein